MMLQRKLERAMEWLKNKPENKEDKEDIEESIELEKNDVLALIISALLVFGPIILFLILILFIVLR